MEMKNPFLGRKGFSLVEISLALVIGSIGLLALAGILTYAMQSNRRATNLSIATALARQKIEQIKLMDYTYVVDQQEHYLNESGQYVPGEQGKFTRITDVTENQAGFNTKTVDVTVYFGVDMVDTLSQAKVTTIIYP